MKPEYIILHHSLTKDSETVSWGAIRDYHMNTLGWRDIGYHFGIERIGNNTETMVGRLWDQVGAHCRARNLNNNSVGVCFIGDYDVRSVPPLIWDAGIDLCRALMKTFGIPRENVLGHREVYPVKTCPGTQFNLNLFRESL